MPSFANFAHVCSHLQNASMARLGVTSIQYTKLHLAFALVLHKQGFISQLKLAGRSPPRSLFPQSENQSTPRTPRRQQWEPAQLASLGEPLGDKESLSELELQFLLDNYKKSEDEIMQILQESIPQIKAMNYDNRVIANSKARSLTTPLPQMDPEHLAELMKTHRRLILEAERLAESQGGGADLVHRMVTRVLQPVDPNVPQTKRRGAMWKRYQEGVESDAAHAEEVAAANEGEEGEEAEGAEEEQQQASSAESGEEQAESGEGDSSTTTNQSKKQKTEYVDSPAPRLNKQGEIIGSYNTDPDDPDEEGIVTQANIASRRLWLGLKYWDGEPVLRKARAISTPKKTITLDLPELKRILSGRNAKSVAPMTNVGEIMVMKTSEGVLESRDAVRKRVGGTALARVW